MPTENQTSNYDDKAWQELESNRLSWNGYDDKNGSVWPCNRNEVRATTKVLRNINYQKLTNQSVKDEYNAQKEASDEIKKRLPNNRAKMIAPLTIMLCVIGFGIWYAFPPRTYSFNENDWIVTTSSEFVSSSSREPFTPLQRKTIAAGTAVTPLAHGAQSRIKVKLSSGDIGYMHPAAFSGIKRNSEVIGGTKVFTKTTPRKNLGSINTEMPRIISTPKIDEDKNFFLKVKTKKGTIGYIYDNHIKYHFCDSLPEINYDFVLPVASTKANKWVGQELTKIENHYSPATARFGATCYWDFVRIIGDTAAYQGITAQVNPEGIIESVQFGKQEKLFASMHSFPVWRMIASTELFYGSLFTSYKQKDRELNIGWWNKLRSSHWTVKFITWIILMILKLAWFLLSISILFLPVFAIGIIISHLESFSYRKSLYTILWLLTFVFLYWIVFTLLQKSFDPISFVILFIAATANLLGFSSHLNRKCSVCGNWDGETTEHTDFLGKSVTVQHGSRDKYMGSDTSYTGTTETSTTRTKHYTKTNYYKRVKTKDTYQYDNYKDHKMCKHCGMRWKESYKILRGEKHEEF